jgi:hypothetical protein
VAPRCGSSPKPTAQPRRCCCPMSTEREGRLERRALGAGPRR